MEGGTDRTFTAKPLDTQIFISAIGEFKLELQSGNAYAQSGSNSDAF